jgi:hypothetical protein
MLLSNGAAERCRGSSGGPPASSRILHQKNKFFIYFQDSSYASRSYFSTAVEPAAPHSIFLYNSRARGSTVPSGKFVKLVVTSARTYKNLIILLISKATL